MSSTTTQDFVPLPTYSQSIRTNESWAVITTTRTDPDGSITQRVAIEAKPASK
jgi:hypothetical protein